MNIMRMVAIAIMVMVAVWLQRLLPIHVDVSWLLQIAHDITYGKQYGRDFYETNPPMILFLYQPAVWLIKTGLDRTLALHLYIFSLIMSCFFMTVFIIKKLLRDSLHFNIFTCTLLLVLLFLPTNQFAQREHLFLIMVLPYLFASVARLEGLPLPFWYSFLTGVLAGGGFGLKPYFLCPLVFLEIWMIWRTKDLWGWARVESITVLIVLTSYLFTVTRFFPGYFSTVLPLINQFYFYGISQPWSFILTNECVLFGMTVFVAGMFFFRQNNQQINLKIMLQISLAGMLASVFCTKTCWFYHVLPAFGIACMIIGYYCGELIALHHTEIKSLNFTILIMAAALMFYLPTSLTIGRFIYYIEANKDTYVNSLKNYLAMQPGAHSILCVSPDIDCFSLIYDTHSEYGGRFPLFWWLEGLVKKMHDGRLAGEQAGQSIEYFGQSIADDLQHFQTRWVIVDINGIRRTFGNVYQFPGFLNNSPQFSAAWSRYAYKTKIGRYAVYERDDFAAQALNVR